MRKAALMAACVVGFLFTATSCKKDKEDLGGVETRTQDSITFDKSKIPGFFAKYPKFKAFQKEIDELYKKHNYHYIWHDKKGTIEFAEVIYNRVNQIEKEGVEADIPYKNEFNEMFAKSNKPDVDSELLISSMYFFYAKNVLGGLDQSKSKQTGWYLPRERTSYVAYLDSLMEDPKRLKEDKSELFSQYYNLRKGLQKYRNIEKMGGWGTITLEPGVKALKQGDSSVTIQQVRKRLHMEGYLKSDSKSKVFDAELAKALEQYDLRHNRVSDKMIGPNVVKDLNIPVADRIRAISLNMERCRWVSPEMNTAREFIAVNIPSFWLQYMRDGKEVLSSRVVVGKDMNKTVVFSGKMSYLAFSPYWNVPKSILNEEILPAIEKNPNYLEKHNMEWNGESVRQKPGGENALGKVKFMFPNNNNIYLHDTPAKSLFSRDERAFSHGCVRVQKARELAIAIMKKDAGWNASKVDEYMNSDTEKSVPLKTKIPVYIAYFTAWADEDGSVSFFEDIYERDGRLAQMLYTSK